MNWHVVLLAATGLGILSSALAWELTRGMEMPAPRWRALLVLHSSYWYLWALFAPAIVWLSQHVRVERRNLGRAFLVHIPAVALFSLAHIAGMSTVRWWLTADPLTFDWWQDVQRSALVNFDREPLTYWALAGLSHAVLYYRESRDHAVGASRLGTQLAEARLAALQQQLQPHFLFNALHAISALMHKDVEEADRTLACLSDLLRLALESSGQHEVPLRVELEFLSKYLEIEQTRFADRLTVAFDIGPETLDARVPNLILQPLVENAIKHGVSRKQGRGHVRVTSRRDGGKLWMEVRDDGIGLSEEGWQALEKGIGLSTTRARMAHLFGVDWRFEFHRQHPGLAVVVSFPWRTEGSNRAEPSGRPDPAGGAGGWTPADVNWRAENPPPPVQIPQ